MTWTILVKGRRESVRGFRKARNGRHHARKHFLRIAERWDDLRPRTAPAEYRARLEARREAEHDAVLDEAVEEYVRLVQRETESHGAMATYGHHCPSGNRRGFYALKMATPYGVFCSFALGRLSGLTTAFRPLPARRRGAVSTAQFQQEARRRVYEDFGR